MNPYAKLKLFVDGLTKENSDEFFEGIDAVVDEVDHFPTKLMIREEAKKRKIPVLMATDVSDSVVLEIERYDTNPKQQFFNGKLDQSDIKLIGSPSFDLRSMAKIFYKIAGQGTVRLQESGSLIGKKLVGPPQLGSTAFLSGITTTYALRKLSCNEGLPSSSIIVDLDTHFLKS